MAADPRVNPIPDTLKSDHLFLLVGTNPLPNWVAARLLTRSEAQVHLVCTNATAAQARRLKAALEQDTAHSLKVDYLETDEANERKIYDDVARLAKNVKNGSVGLNYTGGTKMMSVHAHRAVRNVSPAAIFSYLNASDLTMRFDAAAGQEPVPVVTLSKAQLSAEMLFQLHDDVKKLTFEKDAKSADAAKGLALIHSHEAGQLAWWNWWKGFNADKRAGSFPLWTEDQFQEAVEKGFGESGKKLNPRVQANNRNEIMDGYRQFLSGFQVAGGATPDEMARLNLTEFPEVRQLANWLNGIWLEHYVLTELRACKAVMWNPGGLATNLRAQAAGIDFQADVMALRGYQLYYFSCYSGSDLTTTKLKLFEAIVRAEQFGGEEGRAAVISFVDGYEKVVAQAGADLERVKALGQFTVLGRAHLPKLSEHLDEWVSKRSN